MIPVVLIIVAASVAITTFGVLLGRRDEKAADEVGLTAVHTEICGARIGEKNWSKPFVRLAIHADFIVLSYARKIVLPFAAIVDVRVERTILVRGLHIHHTQPGVPQRLIIWSSNVEALEKELLERLRPRSEPVDGGRRH